jgi:hypothetical protein
MSVISKTASPMSRRRAEALAEITPDRLARRINALPLWARDYIHLLETRVDPQGEIEELVFLRDQNRALIKLVGEMKRGIKRLERAS